MGSIENPLDVSDSQAHSRCTARGGVTRARALTRLLTRSLLPTRQIEGLAGGSLLRAESSFVPIAVASANKRAAVRLQMPVIAPAEQRALGLYSCRRN